MTHAPAMSLDCAGLAERKNGRPHMPFMYSLYPLYPFMRERDLIIRRGVSCRSPRLAKYRF